MTDQYLYNLSNITTEEIMFIKQIIEGLNEDEKKHFMMIYSGKRRDPQHIMFFALLGFFGVAGVQRFATNQIGMGILYFLTAGLCLVGTIIDLINYKDIANEFNHQMALESRQFLTLMN
nr:TM2 domain-containing protein [Pseudopedobacter sp.]